MTIQEIDQKIEFYLRLKAVQSKAPSNFTELVFMKYIELRNTPNVMEFLNAEGHRKEGSRGPIKFIAQDVTRILDDPESKERVDEEVYALVMKMKKSGRMMERFLLEV